MDIMWLPALRWRRPTSGDESSFLAACRGFNYDEKYIGATSEAPLAANRIEQMKKDGFLINHRRVRLGSGFTAFTKGKQRLQNLRHLRLGWVSVDPATQIKVGSKFGIHVHELGAWLINPLQILYVTDSQHDDKAETSPAKQANELLSVKGLRPTVFAFGSGTLRGHLLAGEERFSVEWNKEDDSVWYDILSFSKPAHFLSIAGFPVVRFQQQQFAKHSSEVMVREISRDIGDAQASDSR